MKVVEMRDIGPLGRLYLAELAGGADRLIEFVDTVEPGVPRGEKWVLMVSTQVGCAVGCRMCDGGAMGWRGNLSADEILAQVRRIVAERPELDARSHPKFKIHFARLGEPLLNPAVVPALEGLHREFSGPGLTASISTVAPDCASTQERLDQMLLIKDRLYAGGRFQLQFSAHSTDESVRRSVMRARPWDLKRVADFGRRWWRPGDRKVTLNFALAPDQPLDPDEAARLFDPDRFLVKITPVNPTRAAQASGAARLWTEPPPDIESIRSGLRARGFEVILSPSALEEVEAATSCGQLWSRALLDMADSGKARVRPGYVDPVTLPVRARAWMRELARFPSRGGEPRPERAGLLIVDLLNFFVDPGSPGHLPASDCAVEGAKRLLESFRAAGRPVFYVRHAHLDPRVDGGPMARWWAKVCLEGHPESLVVEALAPRQGETVLRKTLYDSFSNPSLEESLRARGVEDLVVCGLATNLCVESTARSAFEKGFRVFVPADATAAHDEELHLGGLRSLAQGFARVLLVEDILRHLDRPLSTLQIG